MKNKALSGMKVIEYSNGISGSYATKLMADLGADVLKIEPPVVGDKARHIGPFVGGIYDKEKSCTFLYVNSNKKSITLDLSNAKGLDIFKKLAKTADVFLKDGQPEWYDENGIGYEALSSANPGLIMISLTPYGEKGPYKNYKATPLNISHLSMAASMFPQGSPDYSRAPTIMGGNFEQYDLGVMAAIAALASYFYKIRKKEGQYVEISSLEASLQLFNTETVVYKMFKAPEDRTAPMLKSMASLAAPCKDGYVIPFFVQPIEFQKMVRIIGKSEWADEPWLVDKVQRNARIKEIREALIKWLQDKTMDEATEIFQNAGIALGPVNNIHRAVESRQLNERNYFTEINHQVCGKIKYPGRQFILGETPFRYDKAAPLLGEDNREILIGQLGLTEKEYLELIKKKVI